MSAEHKIEKRTFSVDIADIDDLRMIARIKGISSSAALREAIAGYIEQNRDVLDRFKAEFGQS